MVLTVPAALSRRSVALTSLAAMSDEVDFSVLVGALPDLLAVADRDGIVYANPAWTATLGIAVGDLVGGDFFEHVHVDDREQTMQVLKEVWDGTPNTTYSNRLRHGDGHFIDVRWSLVAHGDLLQATGRDISQYRELREKLGESIAVSAGVLATAVDPIIVIDVRGHIFQANEATATLLGYETEDLIGQNVSLLMPEPYRSEHDGYLTAYLEGGDPKVIGRGREVQARRSDGTTFPISLSVSEVMAGERRLFTGIIHDLSERNRQREQLREAARVLELRVEERTQALQQLLTEFRRSNEDLERFAYIASHDLQAPLRNVRQGLELLDEHLAEQTGQGFDEEAQDLRGLVMDSIGRMESLIAGLLSYSRVQTSEGQTESERVDLGQLADDVVGLLAMELDDAGAAVEIQSLPTLEGRGSLLGQVLQNLISNAIRYRSPERDLLITLSGETTDGHVELRVADNGMGIDPSQHDRIFEMFRRGSEEHGGVGIGLALCRRIIEGHGGTISVESRPGDGATFVCRLPIAAGPRIGDLSL